MRVRAPGPEPWRIACALSKPEQTLSVLIVQRQRVIQAVRSLRRNGNLLYNELDPTFSVRFYDEALAIEQQERVEARIANCPCHKLSPDDNTVKRGYKKADSEESAF